MPKAPTPPKLYIPALNGLYAALSPWSYPLIRFVTGMWLVPHGMGKAFGTFGGPGPNGTIAMFERLGLHPAQPIAYLIMTVEFLGGLCIAFGLFTRIAATAAFIDLLVAVLWVHMANGWSAGHSGMEYVLLWSLLCLGIALKGGGAKSLDALVGREF